LSAIYQMRKRTFVLEDTINIDPRYSHIHLAEVSYPVIVVGMPKAGTTSISHFFSCAKKKTTHQYCGRRTRETKIRECGTLIKKNIESGLFPLQEAGDFEVYSQIDVENVKGYKGKGICYFPQVEALEEIHLQYPNATFLLNKRNIKSWIESLKNHGQMAQRIGFCNITGFPPVDRLSLTDDMLRKFYEDQMRRVRAFVMKYPSHRLVEVQIDADDAGKKLVDAFGGNQRCWHQKNTRQDVIEKREKQIEHRGKRIERNKATTDG